MELQRRLNVLNQLRQRMDSKGAEGAEGAGGSSRNGSSEAIAFEVTDCLSI